jgi:hypothetical protein
MLRGSARAGHFGECCLNSCQAYLPGHPEKWPRQSIFFLFNEVQNAG